MINIKKCCKCKQEKSLDCFGDMKSSIDGKRLDCKSCRKEVYYQNHDKMLAEKSRDYYKHKEDRLEYAKIRYQDNPEKYKELSHEYYLNNIDKAKECRKQYRNENSDILKQKKAEYYQRPEVKVAARIKNKEWKKNNPEKRRALEKRYFEKDPIRKIIRNMRNRIYVTLKRSSAEKAGHTIDQLGCTPEFLKQYLESKFYSYTDETGEVIDMNWESFGNGPGFWQVDHAKALCLFNLQSPEEQNAANHYTNLQPLWFHDHNIKNLKDLELNRALDCSANTEPVLNPEEFLV